VAYQHALKLCGCNTIPIPSIPPILPKLILKTLRLRSFPSYLMAFFKYPVVIDGRAFAREFEFQPKRPLKEIFRFYRDNKKPV
jgi:UDP-glucose 4-epimerase